MRSRFLLILAALAVAEPLAAQPAPVTIGQSFLTGSLDASEGPAGWALASHGVAEKLFTVDRSGNVVGALALSAERISPTTWRVRLREGRSFADGTPLAAADVAASLSRTGERNAAARASAGRITVEAVDPRTLMLTSERATPVMPSVLAEWPFAVYRQTPGGFVYTGPYAVDAYKPGESLMLKPNSAFADANSRGAVRIRRFADTQAMALALENAEVDLAFNLPVETLPRLRARRDTTVRSFPVGYQYMMWMNNSRPGLDDPRVRRAIDLAIDRRELVAAVQGGEPATGAFATTYPFALREVRPFDPSAAAALLDQAGWRLDPDGKRRNDGRTLDATLLAYPQRPDLLVLQPVVRARLAAIGLNLQTRVVDQATAVATARDFDLLLWAQHTAPAGDPGFFLNGFFRTGAGNNYAGYASQRVDALLDRFADSAAIEARTALSADVHRQLFEDAPVSFLMTPSWHLAFRPRIIGYEPWGSDYDIVRADLRTQ
jgi:peptide/nickel transport system substrate-binding protein